MIEIQNRVGLKEILECLIKVEAQVRARCMMMIRWDVMTSSR